METASAKSVCPNDIKTNQQIQNKEPWTEGEVAGCWYPRWKSR